MKRLLLLMFLSLALTWGARADERLYLANFDVEAFTKSDGTGKLLKYFEAGDTLTVLAVNEQEHWVKIKLSDGSTGYASLDPLEWINDPSKPVVEALAQPQTAVGVPEPQRELTSEERDAIHEAELVERGLAMGPKMRIVCGIWLAVIAGLGVYLALRYHYHVMDTKPEQVKQQRLLVAMSVLGFIYVTGISWGYSFLTMTTWIFIDVPFVLGVFNGIVFLVFAWALLVDIAPKVPFWGLFYPVMKLIKRNVTPPEVVYALRETAVYLMFWLFLLATIANLVSIAIMIAVTAAAVVLFISIFATVGGFSTALGADRVTLRRNETSGEMEDETGRTYDIKSDGTAKKR